MIEAVGRIARAVKVPVTADIEHAYAATPDAVADVVLRVIAAGAVGVNVEDLVPGTTDLEPISLQCEKIMRSGHSFVSPVFGYRIETTFAYGPSALLVMWNSFTPSLSSCQ
jgi:isopropylmalate/homocitrate/citramalate synthase